MTALAKRWARHGERIGLVPTMGALHAGHASLIRRAAAENDVVIVTIFVNPLQFGPREDVTRYPRTLRRDLALAESAGATAVFAPSVAEMYPAGFQTSVKVQALSSRWEGKSRPGHFEGVATVVTMLLALTQPTRAYFGQKDYQQSVIVRRIVRDLKLPVAIRVLPTIREPDGLAMSSRNAYLTPAQRTRASLLYETLRHARAQMGRGERRAAPLLREMRRRLQDAKMRVDYVAIVDPATLDPVARVRGSVALLVAAWVGRTRLIDNLLVDVP